MVSTPTSSTMSTHDYPPDGSSDRRRLATSLSLGPHDRTCVSRRDDILAESDLHKKASELPRPGGKLDQHS